MNLFYADIIKVFSEEGQQIGIIRAKGGILKQVPLLLIADAEEGDKVLICDGIPISKVITHKKGGNYVSGNTWKST